MYKPQNSNNKIWWHLIMASPNQNCIDNLMPITYSQGGSQIPDTWMVVHVCKFDLALYQRVIVQCLNYGVVTSSKRLEGQYISIWLPKHILHETINYPVHCSLEQVYQYCIVQLIVYKISTANKYNHELTSRRYHIQYLTMKAYSTTVEDFHLSTLFPDRHSFLQEILVPSLTSCTGGNSSRGDKCSTQEDQTSQCDHFPQIANLNAALCL